MVWCLTKRGYYMNHWTMLFYIIHKFDFVLHEINCLCVLQGPPGDTGLPGSTGERGAPVSIGSLIVSLKVEQVIFW
jgi:hypothetical protein